ncbi:hypothetical protein B0H13DRAFT_1943948 [Mycena leptocephala]|nr:hypothetical protein B0H13DRAFT_1943948 [Mycena leptocephala]
MRSTFAPLFVLASFAGVVFSQLMIITPVPAPVTCEPTLISWSGGVEPYFISIVDADDQTSILVNFGTLSNTSLTWETNLPAGTNCLLTIKDSTGAPQNSAPFTITAGPTDCFSSSSGSFSASSTKQSSGSTKPVSTTSSKVSSTTPVSTPASTTPTPTSTKPVSSPPVSSTSGSASVSAPSTSASQTGAAHATSVPAAAAAAALGLLFAALL